MYRRISLLLAVLLLAPVFVVAQQQPPQPQPLTYVAAYRVKPGRGRDFVNLVRREDQPVFERMMSEGAVLAWGVDTVELHHEGEPNFFIWWTMPNAAAMDRINAAFEAQQGSAQELVEMTDPDRHVDYLLVTNVTNVRPVPAGTQPYMVLSRFRVERGRGDDHRRLWERYDKPILDALVADNTILGYGLLSEAFTSMGGGWRWLWVRTTNMAAADRISAAFRADRARRSESERQSIGRQFRELIVAGSAHDDLMRSALFFTRPSP